MFIDGQVVALRSRLLLSRRSVINAAYSSSVRSAMSPTWRFGATRMWDAANG